MIITEREYRDHRDAYDGYCKECDAIGRYGMTEPDAEDYPCEECEQDSCIGMEMALVGGYIQIEFPDEEEEKDEGNK